MSGIQTAIILAAGAGSRLREHSGSKPLCPVGGKPLIDHALEGLALGGIERAIVVTGHGAERIEAHIGERRGPIEVVTVRTPDWQLPNGVSARAAAHLIGDEPALLVMCDHLAEPRLYERVRQVGAGDGLRLGIDCRLGHPWVDPEDVTCVRTDGTLITAIGKGIEPHDAYDTGIFAVGPAFFAALAKLDSPSLTQAVEALALLGKAETVDCSDLDWIDVDDGAALVKAEQAFTNGHFRRCG